MNNIDVQRPTTYPACANCSVIEEAAKSLSPTVDYGAKITKLEFRCASHFGIVPSVDKTHMRLSVFITWDTGDVKPTELNEGNVPCPGKGG